eukprot:CCRYP_016193-RA/>CCRYP_016193-RA protein AED:0.08 eAED:0.08 QI:176/1/1/1/0.93/0.81/16/2046/995
MTASTFALLLLLSLPSAALALNGSGRQSFTTYNGWKAFEVVTQGDSLNGYKLPGQMDGIGAYLMEGGADIRVLLNHEAPYDCDTKNNAAVSELILSKDAFLAAIRNIINTGSTQGVNFVTSVGLAYNSYRTKDGTLVNKFAGNAFKWFCSGKVHKPAVFGSGTGFVDQLYIFGEEADASGGWGRFFALHQNTLHMISGAGSGDATQLQGGINGLPADALENMAMIDTGETGHVALLCSPDYGTQALKLYVGKKGFRTNGQSCGECTSDADILARNGLAFGSTFYLQGQLPTGGGTRSGSFGTNRNSAVSAPKLEDVATSPLDGTKVVLAEQMSGVYELDFNLAFSEGVFSASSSSFIIKKLNIGVSNPDNVEWSADGTIYTVSDDSSGAVTMVRSDGSVSVIAGNKFNGEASGLVDISEVLNLAPSSVFLVNAMTCPTAMSVLVNPKTQLETVNPTKKPTIGPTTMKPTSSPTTQSPTKLCGDGICTTNENKDLCFADCGLKTLVASSIGTNGAAGTMFSIKALRDVQVTSFGFYRNKASSNFVEVYTRVGSYKGHELNQNGWALIHSQAVIPQSGNSMSDTGDFNVAVTIPAGTIQSFFIYSTDIVLYSVGSLEGSVFSSDDSLEFYEGAGVTGKFSGQVVPPRVLSGEIRYDITSLGSMSPTNPPTTKPSNPPTKKPTLYPTTSPVTAKPVTSTPSKAPPTMNPTPYPVTQIPTTTTPTQKPNSCGNDSCEIDETDTTCAQDCNSISLTTHNAGNGGAPGVMFYLKARRDVLVSSLNLFTGAQQTNIIDVYTRAGTYNGHELDPDGWTLVYTRNIQQFGRNTITELGGFDKSVEVKGGTTQSFFIYTGTGNYVMYDTGALFFPGFVHDFVPCICFDMCIACNPGNVEGQLFSSDASLEFYEGVGITSLFSGVYADEVYSPRVFKGEIIYNAILLTDAPSPAPTKSPTTEANCLDPSMTEALCMANPRCRWLPFRQRCWNIASKTAKTTLAKRT